MTNIGIWGLGSMGLGMAQSLVKAGLPTVGHDPRGVVLDGAADLETGDLDIAVIVVLNAAQTESVIDAILPSLQAGAVVVACATVSPAFARDMASRCKAREVLYLDAPISGGAARAAQGDLSIMASGPNAAFDTAQPALDAMARTVFRMGEEVGAGSAMKAVHQVLAGTHIATMAEAMVFGITQGIDPARFMEVLPQCGGTSWMLENRGPHIRDGDYTPHSAVEIWIKDLGIINEIATDAAIDLPMVQAALGGYRKAVEMGLGREDDAAIAKVYAAQAGVKLP